MTMLTNFAACAQTQRIALYEGEVPFNKPGVTVTEVNENNRISRVSKPELYHFAVKVNKKDELKPAIVIVPGGGYAREAFDHEGLMAAQWFSERGYEAFVLKYRLPDRDIVENASNVPLMDGQQAIYLVRSRAREFGVDPSKVGIIGFSAGGHLASTVSTLFAKPVNPTLAQADVRPDFSILMYPVISMDTVLTHRGSRENLLGKNPTQEAVNYYSTQNQVSAQTPVTLMVHAIDDGAVPVGNTDVYANNLFKAGGKVSKVILPIGGHGFGFDPKRPVAYWTGYLETWLKANVK
ncbi:MAG: alpha/beta hydrolase [Breznakibacter sp.]